MEYGPDGVRVMLAAERRGWFSQLVRLSATDAARMPADRQRIAFAVADLRALSEELGEALAISDDKIAMSHRLAAALDGETSGILGLPPLTDLTLRTDAEGVLGTPSFRLAVEWLRDGRVRTPRRIGAILDTDRGLQRLPLWMHDALAVADGHRSGIDDAAQWEALARFRKALEPGVEQTGDARSVRLSMTDFLSNLQVTLVDRFSIAPDAAGDNFLVVPFASDRLEAEGGIPSESLSELDQTNLTDFQRKFRERGALSAYRLGQGRFMVVDRSAVPTLRVMADMQSAPIEQRRAFIRNPRARITAAVEEAMQREAGFSALPPSVQEEMIEAVAGPPLVETREFMTFSARVTGTVVYTGNPVSTYEGSGTMWLPEMFPASVLQRLDRMTPDELEDIRAKLDAAIAAGRPEIDIGGETVPATDQTLQTLVARIEQRRLDPDPAGVERDSASGGAGEKHIVGTTDNYTTVQWRRAIVPRNTTLGAAVPASIRTPLMSHQVESLTWQIDAWKAGLPGILNADEQGLGKTLQTIAFMVWLNDHMKRTPDARRGPMLVVAPTSLLQNWEQEVERHVGLSGLGHLVRLYGSATAARRKVGTRGQDTDTGDARLDFTDIKNALSSGSGHLTWVLTTYQTMTNYMHSLARIPFAVAVFDEVQNIKNPGTLAAHAARAMNADFCIGLTGTPIENSSLDLWSIMEPLAPGMLGSMQDFRSDFGTPTEQKMRTLHGRVFDGQDGLPPVALRRLKEDVARDLPSKTRYLHPRAMPPVQADRYDEARVKLAASGGPGAFKLLHHIRSVSVHPALHDIDDRKAFVAASGRLSATFDILHRIRDRGERALVFIEHRQMQYRFIELAKAEFDLSQIDLINGETPIPRRLEIVNNFQRHLAQDGGFDLLVLGPKAAGTGLTLTAATHVIHLSRWWNPAVEEQCNDRVHRLGQARPVTIHVPLAVHPSYREHSFDLLLQSLMQRKRRLARSALWPMGDTEGDAALLQASLAREADVAGNGEGIAAAMGATFTRDGIAIPQPLADGSWPFE